MRKLASPRRAVDAACMFGHRLAALWFSWLVVAPVGAQASAMLQVDGAVHGVRVSCAAAWAGAGAALCTELPSGSWQLFFAASDAGRPAHLSIDAPGGSVVRVAVATGGQEGANGRLLAATLIDGRTFVVDDGARVRLSARLRCAEQSGPVGLVVRWRDAEHHYRCVVDRARGELRLERRLGDHERVLQVCKLPASLGEVFELELEADGFGLSAWLDDELVLQALDGGLGRGDVGTFVAPGAVAEFTGLRCGVPAPPRAAAAVILDGAQATWIAKAPVPAGSPFAMLLEVARPGVAWPVDAAGFEPALLLQFAEPVFGFGLGSGTVGDDGRLRAAFAWPAAMHRLRPTFRVGGWLGTPDGSALQARLPWVSVQL